MKLIKKTAIALALSSASFASFAMTSIDDAALSQVSGQDGVSIVADLNMNIGSFTYSDSVNGGSVSFNNIGIRGGLIMTVDVLNATQFAGAAGTAFSAAYYTGNGIANPTNLIGAVAAATGYVAGSDVVQFAFPAVSLDTADAHNAAFSVTVGSIATGHGGASFGSVALNKIDLQGTKVWMYGH